MFGKLIGVLAAGALTVIVFTGCMMASASKMAEDTQPIETSSEVSAAANKFGSWFMGATNAASDFTSAAINDALANGAVTQPEGTAAVDSSARASAAACEILAAGTATQEQAFTIYDTGRFAGDISSGIIALTAGDGFAGISEAGAVAVQYIELGQSVQKLVGATAPALPQALTGLCETGALVAK